MDGRKCSHLDPILLHVPLRLASFLAELDDCISTCLLLSASPSWCRARGFLRHQYLHVASLARTRFICT